MAQMACNVYVLTEAGEALLLEAGSTPPEWALPQLGEHTLTDGKADTTEADQPAGSGDEPVSDPDEAGDAEEPAGPPPIKGKGSSAKAWAEYALAHGYEVEPDAKASEIRDALAEAGVPVE